MFISPIASQHHFQRWCTFTCIDLPLARTPELFSLSDLSSAVNGRRKSKCCMVGHTWRNYQSKYFKWTLFEIKIIAALFSSLVWLCGILFPLIVRGDYLNVVWGAHLYFSSLFSWVNESVSLYVKSELILFATYTYLNFHGINPVASRNSNLEFRTHLKGQIHVLGYSVMRLLLSSFTSIHLSYSLTASRYHPFPHWSF